MNAKIFINYILMILNAPTLQQKKELIEFLLGKEDFKKMMLLIYNNNIKTNINKFRLNTKGNIDIFDINIINELEAATNEKELIDIHKMLSIKSQVIMLYLIKGNILGISRTFLNSIDKDFIVKKQTIKQEAKIFKYKIINFYSKGNKQKLLWLISFKDDENIVRVVKYIPINKDTKEYTHRRIMWKSRRDYVNKKIVVEYKNNKYKFIGFEDI